MDTKKLKVLGAVFACALFVGCSSMQTSDSNESAAEAAAAERAAAEHAAAAEKNAAESAAALQTVFYFDFDQSTLSPETRAALDSQVTRLKAGTGKVRLEGHADERGTREYNMALGELRAKAIANYLALNGVERYRIEAVSYGEESPVATGSDDASWAKNRRVELK